MFFQKQIGIPPISKKIWSQILDVAYRPAFSSLLAGRVPTCVRSKLLTSGLPFGFMWCGSLIKWPHMYHKMAICRDADWHIQCMILVSSDDWARLLGPWVCEISYSLLSLCLWEDFRFFFSTCTISFTWIHWQFNHRISDLWESIGACDCCPKLLTFMSSNGWGRILWNVKISTIGSS